MPANLLVPPPLNSALPLQVESHSIIAEAKLSTTPLSTATTPHSKAITLPATISQPEFSASNAKSEVSQGVIYSPDRAPSTEVKIITTVPSKTTVQPEISTSTSKNQIVQVPRSLDRTPLPDLPKPLPNSTPDPITSPIPVPPTKQPVTTPGEIT